VTAFLSDPAAQEATDAQPADLRDKVVDFCRQHSDVTTCALSALRAAATSPADLRHEGSLTDLAGECATRLRQGHPPAAGRRLVDGTARQLHLPLVRHTRGVPADPARHNLEWPLAEQRRRHVHSRIDLAELPVQHQTMRTGRPYALVLTKTPQLFRA
jgi:hypothetical protein